MVEDITDRTSFFSNEKQLRIFHQDEFVILSNVFRKREYLESKLYNAFYAFESLTVRPASSLVCGVCGIIPDILYGEFLTLNHFGQMEYIQIFIIDHLT